MRRINKSSKNFLRGVVLAAPVSPGTGIDNPALGGRLQAILAPGGGGGSTFFTRLIQASIGLVFVASIVAFFFYLLLGAFDYITSGGDKQAVQNAQSKIRHALIGFVVLFSAYAVVRLLETFLGVALLTIDISQLFI